jgi:hypothetical protein
MKKIILLFAVTVIGTGVHATEYSLNMADYVRSNIQYTFTVTDEVKNRINKHVTAYVYKKANPDFEYAFTAGADFNCNRTSANVTCTGEFTTESGDAYQASFVFMLDGGSPIVKYQRGI